VLGATLLAGRIRPAAPFDAWPPFVPALDAEGGAAVALQFSVGDEEAGGVAVGDADSGELAAEDVLLDGGGA